MGAQRLCTLGMMLWTAGCAPDFKDGTILCERDAQCYAGAQCRLSPERQRKYCYTRPPREVDASDSEPVRRDAAAEDAHVGESQRVDAAAPDAGAPPRAADAGHPDAATQPNEPMAPLEDAGTAPCPTLGDRDEVLDDAVEDLGELELPEGWTERAPGPAAWLADGSRFWAFPSATRAGAEPPSGTAIPPNYPSAAWIVSGSQSRVKLTPPPTQVPSPFALLVDDEAPDTVLWPSTVARNLPGKNKDTVGLAFLRRSVAGVVTDVMLARITAGSTTGSRISAPLFTGTDRLFSTGLFSGSFNTYVYACEEDTSKDELVDQRFRCFVARTVNERIEERASYEVYQDENGVDTWTTNLSAGTPVLYGALDLSMRFEPYLNDKRMAVHVHPKTGRLIVQTAQRPWGPWAKRAELALPVASDAEPPASAFVIMEGGCGKYYQVAYATPTQRDAQGNVVAARTRVVGIRWR
jgi:hypothetical protein